MTAEQKKDSEQLERDGGLPEIAEKDNAQKFYKMCGVALFVVAAIILIYSVSHSGSAKKEKEIAATEDYSITQDKQVGKDGKAPAIAAQAVPQKEEAQPNAAELEAIQKKARALQERLSAPMLAVNNKAQTSTGNSTATAKPTSNDQNTQFMTNLSAQNSDVVSATVMGDLGYLIAEGALIHGVLETAVNSDLPGYLRAIVAKPVYSENGARVLIPEGSRLIGQYKSGLMQGQSRVFVVWTRLILPSGISIKVASEGTDNLGVAGMGADSINRHFWGRFGEAILLSIIGAGAENVGVSGGSQYNAAQAYRVAMADSLANSANQSLQQNGSIAPTLRVNQGKPIIVFVAHDLDFKSAMQTAKPKINIF